ncbi:MAG: hypothetical protein KTR29_22920 [Rhodothermaceae bacterium]|nr:hypothetical protein [Rhodothermaceae bacterium]
MYLRFDTCLEFPDLARRLCPEMVEGSLDWDTENVYEWMYINLPHITHSLNVSREHGWADIQDEIIDQYENDQEGLKQLVQPGSVYVIGWDRTTDRYVDNLPDSLPSLFADQLGIDVSVFSGRFNVDEADGEPIRVVRPNPDRQITM